MNAPSLELIGFSKRFGALVALDDVSVRVQGGSFRALLGENGAGKSITRSEPSRHGRRR